MTLPPLTVAFVCDPGMILPTLRAMDAVLRHAVHGARVLFAGVSLTPQMWDWVAQVAANHPASRVRSEVMPPEWLAGRYNQKSFITTTALGRLYLPRLTGGRVLYLDGDILVQGDVTAAAGLDLRGNPLAGVRDFQIMKKISRGRPSAGADRQAAIMPAGFVLADYVNSGVLLMDNDRIRATPGLVERMEDMEAVQSYPLFDQDHVNVVFRDRITHLDPVWNASWGRAAMQRDHQAGLPMTGAARRALIVHFHGPHKPWKPVRLSSLSRNARAVWQYRRDMALFRRRYPGIPDFLPQ